MIVFFLYQLIFFLSPPPPVSGFRVSHYALPFHIHSKHFASSSYSITASQSTFPRVQTSHLDYFSSISEFRAHSFSNSSKLLFPASAFPLPRPIATHCYPFLLAGFHFHSYHHPVYRFWFFHFSPRCILHHLHASFHTHSWFHPFEPCRILPTLLRYLSYLYVTDPSFIVS